MKKYAFYCSGNASRVIKIFQKDKDTINNSTSFVLYDGGNDVAISKLKSVLPKGISLIIEDYHNIKENQSQFLSDLLYENAKKFNVDYIFCFGNKILKKPLIDIYKNRIINFHPSLLPAFPGLNAIDQALNSSVQVLGNTAHFIDEGIDTGPIIMQTVISRKFYKTYDDVLDLQIPMLFKIHHLIENNLLYVEDNKVVIKNEIPYQVFFSS